MATSEDRSDELAGARGGVHPGPEQRLLLEVALGPIPRALVAWRRWRDLRGERGLGKLDLASAHLLPLVARRLADVPVADGDPGSEVAGYHDGWEAAQLRAIHRRSLGRNVALLHKTATALARLADADLDVVLVGEAALALRVYPDRGARTLTQADLWLPGGDLARAAALLASDGAWRAAGAPHPDRVALAGDDDLALVLRRDFLPESRIASPGADATVRARATRTANWTLLAPEEALVHAAVTGFVWTPDALVDWVADVALTVSAFAIDWERILLLAASYHISLPIGAALGVLPAVGVPVPADVLRDLVRLPKTRLERDAFAARCERAPLDPQALWAEWRFRYVPDQSPLTALRGFPGYVAGRLGLPGASALPAFAWQSLRDLARR